MYRQPVPFCEIKTLTLVFCQLEDDFVKASCLHVSTIGKSKQIEKDRQTVIIAGLQVG